MNFDSSDFTTTTRKVNVFIFLTLISGETTSWQIQSIDTVQKIERNIYYQRIAIQYTSL